MTFKIAIGGQINYLSTLKCNKMSKIQFMADGNILQKVQGLYCITLHWNTIYLRGLTTFKKIPLCS